MIISCGYQSVTPLPVTWIINGTAFTERDIVLLHGGYRLNNPTTPNALSLMVLSINGNTTFQCIVHSTQNISSTFGAVVINGM